MKCCNRLFLTAMVLGASAECALARQKVIGIGVNGLEPVYSAFDSGSTGISLGPTGHSGVAVSVVLPPDYKKNSPITVKLYFYYTSPSTNCAIYLRPDGVDRFRPGALRFAAPGSTSGLTGDGVVVFAPPANVQQVFTKTYTLRRPTDGQQVKTQKSGDSIVMSFDRLGDDASDQCPGNLNVVGAKLIYTTR